MSRLLKGCAFSLVASTVFTVCVGMIFMAVSASTLRLAYVKWIVQEPGKHLDRDQIMSTISQETTVWYADGETRVGVFFDDQHRVYIEPDALPPGFAFAIVASEDGKFWNHYGIDPLGITRAMAQNVAAGHVVSGGSTLSQQTAKNLFKRPDRSLKSKFGELFNTIKLEAHYDKREILTFYANQFHVAGNGRGLGIAGRYFFDIEDPKKLSVLQMAYIAGLVKGPSNYDPWLGDDKRRKRAVERAHTRTRYVLGRIVHESPSRLQGPYPKSELMKVRKEAQRLLDEGFELPFKRGTFRYDRSIVVDEVSRRMKAPPFDKIMREAEIEHPESAGLQITTTLDPMAQREATYALWHHLTEVGIMQESLPAEAFLAKGKVSQSYDPSNASQHHSFHWAKIQSKAGGTIRVDLGGAPCLIDEPAIKRAATAVVRGKHKNKYKKATNADKKALIKALPKGKFVLVSVREETETGPLCDLELRPELQGAVTVVQNGKLRAMVGGNDNRAFNRARAPRQMGSTWKPLVFHAAIELGWGPDEELENWNNIFSYGTVFYYPSADHHPAQKVTMAMAGVNSENVASVWLLYHLTDPLDQAAFGRVAAAVDMAQRRHETAAQYKTRIQKEGVQITRGRRDEAAFHKARHTVMQTHETWPHPEDKLALRSMLYGYDFDGERKRLEKSDRKQASRDWKNYVLDHSWKTAVDKWTACQQQLRILKTSAKHSEVPAPHEVPDLKVWGDGDVLRVSCGHAPRGKEEQTWEEPNRFNLEPYMGKKVANNEVETMTPTVAPEPEPEVEETPSPEPQGRRGKRGRRGRNVVPQPTPRPQARPKKDDHFHQAWSSTPVATHGEGLRIVDEGDMLIDGRIHASTLRLVQDAIQPLEGDSYRPDVLYWSQDFRVLVSIKYVLALAKAYGIRSDVKEILPMPLGASEITVEEETAMYEGLVTGRAWDFPGKNGAGMPVVPPADPTLLIEEIRTADGELLYKAEAFERQVAYPQTGELTADILRSVVEWGTGRRARYSTKAGKADVPLGGKTGTTNDFRNAAFLGYAPVGDGKNFSLTDAYAIGVYVGYDDNRKMKTGNHVLAGASGALPTWTLTAKGLGETGRLGDMKWRKGRMKHSSGLHRIDAEGKPVLTWQDGPPPLKMHFAGETDG